MGISPTLNIPQARFLAMQHKFKAYVAGFGSGKTWVGCGGICKGMWEHPRINQGYFAPTYPQIRDIFYGASFFSGGLDGGIWSSDMGRLRQGKQLWR